MIYINDSSRVWHVAKTGNDSNSGHAGQYPINLANDAKLTINAAVSAAADGDTIVIWPGTYDEKVDLVTAAKSLKLVGMSRGKSIIYNQTDGGHALILKDDCEVHNLYCKGGTGSSTAGINATGKSRIIIENCIVEGTSVSGNTDGLQLTSSIDCLLRNSIFISPYDGATVGGSIGLRAENCVFKSTGGVANETRGLLAGTSTRGIFTACHFVCDRSSDNDYKAVGASVKDCIFHRCLFYAKTSLQCNADATAVNAQGGVYDGCWFFAMSNTGYSYLHIAATNNPVVVGGYYYPASVTGTIKQLDSNAGIDSSGRVDIRAIKGVDADTLLKAVKLLKNKAVQDKLTGAIRYYDDDGQTVVLTHTPNEDGTNWTRMVS